MARKPNVVRIYQTDGDWVVERTGWDTLRSAAWPPQSEQSPMPKDPAEDPLGIHGDERLRIEIDGFEARNKILDAFYPLDFDYAAESMPDLLFCRPSMTMDVDGEAWGWVPVDRMNTSQFGMWVPAKFYKKCKTITEIALLIHGDDSYSGAVLSTKDGVGLYWESMPCCGQSMAELTKGKSPNDLVELAFDALDRVAVCPLCLDLDLDFCIEGEFSGLHEGIARGLDSLFSPCEDHEGDPELWLDAADHRWRWTAPHWRADQRIDR